MSDIVPGAALALCVVFVASAASKVSGAGRRRSFIESLRPLGLLPERLLVPVGIALMVVETALATGLIGVVLGLATGVPGTGAVAVTTMVGAAGLLVVLSGGIAVVLRRGTRASCACFGAAAKRPLSRWHLVRNGALLLVAAGGAGAAAAGPGDRVEPAAVLLQGIVGVLGALLLIRLEDLLDLFTPTGPARSRS